MQFETKIVNGKPSIFFKEEPSKSMNNTKKLTTRGKKDIRKAIEISGETDLVKPSARITQQQLQKVNSLANNTSTRNGGINITQEQLDTLLKALQSTNKSISLENLNFNSNDNSNNSNSHDNYDNRNESQFKMYKPIQPKIVVNNDDDYDSPTLANSKSINNLNGNDYTSTFKTNPGNINITNINNAKSSLIDKKKLKWQQDLETNQKLAQQEVYDQQKFGTNVQQPTQRPDLFQLTNNPRLSNTTRTNDVLSMDGSPTIPYHKSTMTLAEKKKLQWQQEREKNNEYVGFHNSASDLGTSNAYNKQETIQNNIMDSPNKLRKSNSFSNLTTNEQQIILNELHSKNNFSSNDVNNMQQQRHTLMEKKQEKWNLDKKASDDHWPYGKPGVGVGPKSTERVSNLPPQPPQVDNQNNNKSKKYREALEEYNKISQTLASITEAENKIKREKLKEVQNQEHISASQPNAYHDQSKVPAAMRTSILFGDVMFDDDIKRTRELEKRKWLQELEEQKKEKLIESQRNLSVNVNTANNNANKYSNINMINQYDLSPRELKHLKVTSLAAQRTNLLANLELSNGKENNVNEDEEKNFGRTRKLLDPAQIEELERKRKQALAHKKEIDAQIAEKRRIQQLEEEIQQLNLLKVENEARKITAANQANQELKRQQPQFHNVENVLNLNNSNNNNNNNGFTSSRKPDTMGSILQHDDNMSNEPTSSNRGNGATGSQETRAKEIFRKMQEAELAAAEEKHKRLLKRLQRGGHDTKQLEKKFAELKARLSGNPTIFNTNQNSNYNSGTNNINSLNNHQMDSQRNQTAMSYVSDEQNLERQKQFLEKKLKASSSSNNEATHKENDYELNNEQKSKIKQIFQLLREDTTGLPAELSEENLKVLLKQVEKNNNNNNNSNYNQRTPNNKSSNKPNQTNKQQKQSPPQQQQQQQQQQGEGKKPIWNYKNLQGRKAISNSMKDPFYNERAKILEERRKRYLEHYQTVVDKNSQKYNEYMQDQQNSNQNDDNDEYDRSKSNANHHNYSSSSSMSNYSQNQSNHHNYNHSNSLNEQKVGSHGNNRGQESILNLLTKNLATNTIYEEDEDQYLNVNTKASKKPSNQSIINNNQSSRIKNISSIDDLGEYGNGFVPFMRTNEFLDPAHAASPVPPSRESSAVKKDREKARQAYFQNMKPADYGSNYHTTYDAMNDQVTNRNRMKDPLLNNGLVTKNPTPRQEQILSQLASLKQSLIQKQKEVASSINIDNNDYYNLED